MITINDHGEFKRAAKRAHEEAAKVQKELTDANVETAKRIRSDIAKVAASILPKRGGLAGRVAGMDIKVERKTDGAQIVGTSDYDVVAIDQGTVRHLVYGHGPLVTQSVTPGFWTKTIESHADDFESGMVKSLEKINDRLEKG